MKLKLLGLVVLLTIFLISASVFSAQFTITPSTRAVATYTDNVNLTKDDKEDDFLITLWAGITAQLLGKTSGASLSTDIGYSFYDQNSDNNTFRLPLLFQAWTQPTKNTRINFTNRFLRTEDPEGDKAVISEEDGEIIAPGDTTVRRGRDPYWTNYTSAGIDHQFGIDDSVYGNFIYSLRREDDSGPDSNENDRYSPSAGLTYWFGPKWGTTVDAVYTRATFKNSDDYHDIAGIFQLNRRFSNQFQLFGRYGYAYRDNDGDDQDNDGDDQEDEGDYQLHTASAGFNYALAKDSRISLGLGYYYQEYKDSDIDTEQGPFVTGDLYKLWDYQRWSARLLGQSGLDRNDFGNQRLGLEWFAGITGNATYNFTRNFSGNVVGRYRYSDVIGASREDNRFSVGGGVGWRPTKWMALNLDYTFNKLDSNSTEGYDENRVWLGLTLQPDKPWRW